MGFLLFNRILTAPQSAPNLSDRRHLKAKLSRLAHEKISLIEIKKCQVTEFF